MIYKSSSEEHIELLKRLIISGHSEDVDVEYCGEVIKCKPARGYLNMLLFNVFASYGLAPDLSWFFSGGYTNSYKSSYPNMIIDKVSRGKKLGTLQKLGSLMLDINKSLKKMVILGSNVSLDISITSWMDDIAENDTLVKLFSNPIITDKNTPEEVRDRKLEVIHDFKDMNVMEPIPTFLRSGTSISEDQIGNMFTLGIRPLPVKPNPAIPSELAMTITLEGRLNGIANVQNKFIDDSTARLADIMSKRCIQDAGKTSKQVSLVVQEKSINDIQTGESMYDCGTKHYYKTVLATQKELDDMHGKYHMVNNSLQMINKSNKDLIGVELSIRTVAKCACKTGVCQVCVGAFASNMMNTETSNYHFGVLGVKTLIATAAQLIISAKHNNKASLIDFKLLQLINGIPHEISEDEQDCFKREGTEIVVDPRYAAYLVDIREPTADESKELNIDYVIGEGVEFMNTDTGEIKSFTCNSEFRLYSKDNMNLNRLVIDNKLEFNIRTMSLKYKALNKALTDIYYKLLNIIGMKIPNENNLTDAALVDYLLLRARKEIPGFHFIPLEIIISSLLRDKSNHREVPDWSQPNPKILAIGLGKANRITRTTSFSKLLGLGNYNSLMATPTSYYGVKASPYDVLYNVMIDRDSTTQDTLMGSLNSLIKDKIMED